MTHRLELLSAILCISLSTFAPGALFAQQSDSTKAAQTAREAWFNQPPSGKTEKTQGAIIAALGASSVISGLIYLQQDDPCDDFSGSNVFCTSNADQVHVVGAVTLALGVGGIIYGLIRYQEGSKKARTYDAWKRKNKLSAYPFLRYDGRRLDLGVSIALRD